MEKKLTKRELQAMETRKKIFDTARRLFSEYGYSAVSIDDIVREAGVARGSFYVYFLSKEDLSVYLMMADIGVYREVVTKLWSDLDRSLPAMELLAQLSCGICAMVESWGVETMRLVYKIFLERAATTDSSFKSIYEVPELFTALYELGVSRNEFIPADTAIIAGNIQTILVGLTYQWCLYNTAFDFIGNAKSLITDYLKGFSIK